MKVLLLVAAVVIVVALAGYAAYLWMLVRKKRDKQQRDVDKLLAKKAESERYARDSIQILLRGLQQEQVTLTEVAIRITGLIQVLPQVEQHKFILFTEIADKTSHIPIKEAWKALSKRDKRKFDQERETVEASYQVRIDAVVPSLLTGADAGGANTLFVAADQVIH